LYIVDRIVTTNLDFILTTRSHVHAEFASQYHTPSFQLFITLYMKPFKNSFNEDYGQWMRKYRVIEKDGRDLKPL